ncbi:MAG TPA: hypothetical protein VJR89_15945 [Polyangiales bacterium]|nr:hypothetical protein [Polyangiales bacterium]
MNDEAAVPVTQQSVPLSRIHLRFGWLGLLVFAVLGIALEGLHAWKSSAYLGVGQETRRLMWTLAHAHGIGLSLVHLGFAATLGISSEAARGRLQLASQALRWSSVLIPLGFFAGGVVTYEGDPGVGVFLVPLGAVALLVALVCAVWVVWSDSL